MTEFKVIRVSRTSNPMKVAGSIKYFVDKDGQCELHVMGPKAINIATKSLAQLISSFKFSYSCVIEYFHFKGGDGKQQTGIKYTVYKK